MSIQCMGWRAARLGVATLLVGAFVTSSAAEISVAENMIEISAVSPAGTAELTVPASELYWDSSAQSLSWEVNEPLQLTDADSDVVLATLEFADLQITEGSKFTLGMRLTAGVENVTFTFRAGPLSFPSLPAAEAEGGAFASFSVQDMDNDGAFLMGDGGEGLGAFRAYYNDSSGGELFAHLVGVISASAGATAAASQSAPIYGLEPIGADVDDMSIELAFVLSASDRVTVTSFFDVDPDPAAWADDSDADGAPDWFDGCPDDPNKADPGACGCGVSEGDCDEEDVGATGDYEAEGGAVGEVDDPQTAPDGDDDQPPDDELDGELDGERVGDASSADGGESGAAPIGLNDAANLVGSPCGAGVAGFAPLALLTLGCCRAGAARRR